MADGFKCIIWASHTESITNAILKYTGVTNRLK